MAACNKRPPPEHPMHSSLVACHMLACHEGPCAWELEPSPARRGIDRLLAVFSHREIASIDSQPQRPIPATDPETGEVIMITRLPAGPWVLVKFAGGDEYAIWKETGAVYRVGLHGAVDDNPVLDVSP